MHGDAAVVDVVEVFAVARAAAEPKGRRDGVEPA